MELSTFLDEHLRPMVGFDNTRDDYKEVLTQLKDIKLPADLADALKSSLTTKNMAMNDKDIANSFYAKRDKQLLDSLQSNMIQEFGVTAEELESLNASTQGNIFDIIKGSKKLVQKREQELASKTESEKVQMHKQLAQQAEEKLKARIAEEERRRLELESTFRLKEVNRDIRDFMRRKLPEANDIQIKAIVSELNDSASKDGYALVPMSDRIELRLRDNESEIPKSPQGQPITFENYMMPSAKAIMGLKEDKKKPEPIPDPLPKPGNNQPNIIDFKRAFAT